MRKNGFNDHLAVWDLLIKPASKSRKSAGANRNPTAP
jgi:hypothetical protein